MTAATATVTEQKGPDRGLQLLFAGLMVTMLLASLNQTILSTALPTVVGELNGVDQMPWVITSYILASTITMPVYGKISDLFGRKPVLIAAIITFLAGSVICALTGDVTWLIVGRVVQGLGGGGLMILSQAAIADVVPPRERGRYMGVMGAVFAVSSIAGPLLGGWFTEGPGWRWTFWINLPLGLLAILAAFFFLKLPARPDRERPRLDYPGMALIAAATTALVLVGTWGGSEYAWTSPTILGLAAAAVVLGVAFVYVESRAAEPIIPLGLFRDRNFTLATAAGLCVGIMMFGTIGYMPTYLQMVTGVSATNAGMLMIPAMGGMLVASTVAGRLVSRTGRYKLSPLLGVLVMGTSLLLLASLRVDTAIPVVCAYLGVFGVGLGMSMQILTLIVQNSFPNSQVGTATAATNYFRQVGATLGSAVVGSIFATRLTALITERIPAASERLGGLNSFTPALVGGLPDELRLPIITSYNEALLPIFGFMVPLAVLAAVLLVYLREKPLATTLDDGPAAPAAGGPSIPVAGAA
ncbi:MDR family MFS transporter [Melissospora conviva]|uniref:MDR family MFS transporter n=1 Tax=Melissospora conviva TaxID=3388432 RepID=UPI003C1FDD33